MQLIYHTLLYIMILEEYMSQEKLLLKKFNRLNYLKGVLVSRGQEDRGAIKEEIQDIIDDINLIVEDSDEDYAKVSGYRAGRSFTIEELEEYDGEDGKSAYVAIDNKIYDVTKSPFWRAGKHFGLKAGRDLTEEFYSCHANNLDAIKDLEVVGVLKE